MSSMNVIFKFRIIDNNANEENLNDTESVEYTSLRLKQHLNVVRRCNHVKGCIAIDDKTETKEKTPQPEGLSNSQDASNGQNNVVTYMTCVAVGSVLVVVCGLLVKNREAICRRSGSMTAMKNEITKRKRQNFGPGKSCGKDKKESLYAEINEKYMINFDGE